MEHVMLTRRSCRLTIWLSVYQRRNQLRDNNVLKDQVKEHDKCIENTELTEYKHKQELTRLQV